MLEHLGAGNGALLVDVTDHKYRDALPLGELHERHRAVLDLTDAARGRIQLLVVERLDGVHDQNVRRFLADTFEHVAETGLREHIKVAARDLEPLGAHLELVRRFLAGYIQDLGKAAELTADLQHQRRFADARRAADEHQRALDGSPAEHTVQLAHTGRKAQLLLGLQLGDRMRLAARERLSAPLPCRRRLRRGLLHDGIPCAAGRAAPRPLCGLVAALGAVKYGFCLHGVSPFLFLMLPLAHRRVPRESRRRRSQPTCADSPSRRALRPPPRWRESRTRPAPRDS